MLTPRRIVFPVLIFLLLLLTEGVVKAQWLSGYNYRRKIATNDGVIPDGPALLDFPLLVDLTNVNLRTCSNGGLVNSATGDDITFTTSDGTTQLYYQLEKYDPAAGRIIAWVRVPRLETTVSTSIYIYFGNPSIAAPQSSTAVWLSGYVGVWHFNDWNDATSYGGNATPHNGASLAASGVILGDASFSAASRQYAEVINSAHLNVLDTVSVSAWIYLNSLNRDQKIIGNQAGSPTGGGYKFGVYTNNKYEFEIRDASDVAYLTRGASTRVLNTNTWYYVSGVYSDVENFLKSYYNGAIDATVACTAVMGSSIGTLKIGCEPWAPTTLNFDGYIDELRVYHGVRTENWFRTEYQNQVKPTTFSTSTTGTEYNISANCKSATIYLNSSGAATLSVADVDNGSSSGCSITKSISKTSFNCSNYGSNNVTLTVKDNVLNKTSTCVANVTVADNIPPSVTCKNISVNLDATGSVSISPSDVFVSGSDNCGTVNLVSVSPNTFNCSDIGANTVTLTVNDGHGNTNTCTSTVTVSDNIAPTITCKNITVNLNGSGSASITPADVYNTGSDNCGTVNLVSVTPNTFNCSNIGANTVTLTVNDGHGNTSTCTSTVTVADNTPPSITCKNITVNLNGSGSASITPADVYNSGSDNCGTVNLVSVSPNTFNCSNIGANTVTLTVNDGHGNTSTCTPTVTVADNIPPTVTCKNITVYLNGSGSATITPADVYNNGSDNCGTVNLVSVTPNTFNCTNIGANSVTLTVNDGHGNTSTCTSTVTVADNTPPSITCKNITVNLNGSGSASIAPADVYNSGSDNCGTVNLVSVSPNTFNCSNIGANTVTLTVNDGHGNTSTCTPTVTVADNIPPTVTCKNITAYLNGSGSVTITPADVYNNGSDNCGTVNPVSVTPNTFNCTNIGANTVTLTVNDGHGNTSTCTSTVTVADNTPPSITCKNITVYLNGSGSASITPADVYNSGSDNCGTVNLVSVTPNTFNCSNLGANTVTLTVNDGHGNTNTCTSTVTVADNIAPSVTCKNISLNLNGSGSASIIPADVFNSGSDNCGTVNLVSVTPNTFDCSNLGANTVTLTVNDGHGNTSTCTSTVTVADNIAPTVTCKNITAYLNGSGSVTIAPSDVYGSGSDNCGTVNLVSVTPNTFSCSNIGANTVTLTVNDGHGNTSTCNSTVTVADNIAPAITCKNITVYLNGSGSASIIPADVYNSGSDNCGTVNLVSVSPNTFNCSNLGANTVTLTVNDGHGNTSTCTPTVTVADNIPPTVTCKNITVYLNGSGSATITPVDVYNNGSDNCGTVNLVSVAPNTFNCSNVGPNTVTLTVNDGHGNTSTCSSTVTVTDNIAPTITCPANVTAKTSDDGTGNCTTTVALGVPTTADNCGVASTIAQVGGVTINPATYAFTAGSTTVTWIVTDAAGHTASCNQTVTVTDDENPTITCPANVTAKTSDDGTGNCTTTVALGVPTTGDNCGVASTIAQVGGVTINPATYAFTAGSTTVTWIVTDAAGHTASCNQTVTVTDDENPTITCPANVTAKTSDDGTGNCTTTVALGVPTTADNCGVASTIAQIGGVTINPATYAFTAGSTTVTWIVTDAAGHTASCNQTVTVTDDENPTITCPANVTAKTSDDGTGNCTTTVALGVPTTADNCGVASTIAQVGGVTINPATYAFTAGLTTVTWIVTDAAGHTASCNQTVTVTDDENPTITCPANVTAKTSDDGTGNCTTTVALGVPTTADNCGVASTIAQVGGVTINPATYAFTAGSTTVTWIVTDAAGHTASCNQTVTVTDDENPTITCPANVTAKTSDDGTGNCTTTVALGVPTTGDNCGVASTIAQVGGVTINPATYAFTAGTTTVTWIVTDAAGHTASCNQTVTVTDDENPTITCPANVTAKTSDDGTGNCTTTVALGVPTTADNCGVASTIAQVGGVTINPATYAFTAGSTTVTWIVTDAAGHTASCNQTVTVTDDENPTITCPANVTAKTSDDGTGNCTTTVALGVPTTADNCGVASTIAQVGGVTINPATYAFTAGSTTVTWIVTDAAGHTASCNQTVTVTDDENPTITCPANVTAKTSDDGTGNCTTTVALGVPTTADNCGVASTIAQVGGVTINPATYAFTAGSTTVTWIVTDAAGHTASCNQTVTVTDDENPTITCPANVTAKTSDDGTGNCTTTVALGAPVTNDNCGVASTIAQVGGVTINPATYAFTAGSTTVTWIVTDAAGHTASCNQTVTVTDDENPTITCPANVTAKTSDDGTGNCTTTVALGVPTTGDNCGVASTIAQVGGVTINPATYAFTAGNTTVTWIVTDAAGHTASCNQTVTVTDDENPTITCPANVTAKTSDDGTGNCTTTVALGVPTTADNCGVASTIAQVGGVTINPATYAFTAGSTTVTWIVTDAAGHTASCNQTVTVTDDENPTITCPANVTAKTSDDGTGNCTTTVALGVPTTADNCGVASTIAQVGGVTINPATYAFTAGLTTVTWIVTDAAGHTASCNQTVTVTDDENPTITCPANVTAKTSDDGTGNCTTTVALGVPTTADNCGVASTIAQVGGVTINPATYAFTAGSTTVTWIVTDAAGHTASCNQTVTVTDDENPTITCPANVTAKTSDDGTGNCTTTVALGAPVTNDNCGVASTIAQVGGVTINPATYAFTAGSTTVTWIVTDAAGHTASCNQTVTVTDDENPTITCPANVTAKTSDDGTGNCTTTVALGVPVTNDNCGVASTIAQIGGVTINPATYAFTAGTTTVTWIVTDAAGHTASCNQTVTVTDDENPTITCPANVTAKTSDDGTGNCTTTVALGVPVTNDNCGVASTIAQVGGVTINPATYAFTAGNTTVTWIVTDAAGHTASCNQTVTVTDDENPTITCPANVTAKTSDDGTGNCTTTVALGVPTTADNCGVASTIAQVGGVTINPATYAFTAGSTTVTWIVTDAAGHTASCNQTVTVTDDENPTITCPANVTAKTSDDGTGNCTTTVALGVPTTADNCGVASTIAQIGGVTINPATYAFTAGSTTVTWIVTDAAGHTASCNQTVTVTDDENPTITCPANVTAKTSDDGTGNCTTTVALGVPTTADNCGVASTIAQVGGVTINPATYAFTAGSTTVTWIVTDAAGHTASCNQTVTVTDDENPTITCPANVTAKTSDDGTGNCTTTVALGAPVTNDNCGVASTIAQVGGVTINPATYAFTAGSTTVTWIVTDAAGHTASCNQTVTVTDDENPTITCPANVTAKTSDDGTGNCTTTVALGVPTTADNCGVASTIAQVGGVTINPATYAFTAGTTTVTWIVTDAAGHTASCNQTVTVTDDENPTITCPANVTAKTSDDGTGNCTTTVALGVPTTADNCGVASTIAQVGGVTINPATYAFTAGLTTVTWIVTDAAGHTASCNQTVTVTDDENPTITCPANVTAKTSDDGTGNCTTTVALGVPTTADNCGVASTIAQVGGVTINPATYAFTAGSTTVTWIVTDAAGHTASCNQTVTVTDDENPTITCPANVTAKTSDDGTGNCTTTVALGVPTTADNCGVASTIAQVGGVTINPATYAFTAGTTTVTWIVTDAAGHTASCNQTVTVTDDENPTITCPANVTAKTSDDGTGNCTTTVALGVPTTADNCGVASTIAQVGGVTINPATYAFTAGLTTVTWIVTDAAGHTASCNQTVTVTDDENPTITCPANVTAKTSDDGTGNCTTTVALGVPTTADNCGVASTIAQVGGVTINPATYAFTAGSTTVTWIVTDAAGHTASCNQTVTVTDDENPTITCPANVTAKTSDDGTGNCTTTVALGVPTTGDNCGVASTIAQVGGVTINPATYAFTAGSTTVTWIVTDAAGHTASCNQTVTVTDDENPTITCPANVTAKTSDDGTGNCTTTVALGVPTTADNCGVASTIAQVGGVTINPATYAFTAGLTTVTWIVTDAAGHTASCNQTVTVTDDENPTITCPANVTAKTSDDGTGNCTTTVALGVPTTADNCGVASTIAQVGGVTINPATYAFTAGSTTVTWIVTDAAGHTASCNQTVTVTDDENPTITCPANVTAKTSDDGTGNCTTTVALGVPTTGDNCGVASTIAQVGGVTINPATYDFTTGSTTVTWIVTDAAGHTASCNQTVTVTDDENPTITCPANVTAKTSDDGTGNCTTTVALGVPVTNDNCGVASIIAQVGGVTINPATYAFTAGSTTVTWIVTDAAGHTASCNQTVTVTDDENPTITCPADVTAKTSDDGTGNCTTTVALGVPTTADNCGVASTIAQVGGVTINPATYAFTTGSTTVTWIVTDAAGHTASCNQTVTVTDDEFPTITCVGNQTKNTDPGVCTYTVTGTEFDPTATWDNCSINSVTNDYNGLSSLAGAVFPLGTTTVIWTIEDGSGNKTTCSYTVTVEDHEFPTISCVGNQTKNTDPGVCTYTVTGTEFDPTATWDNCSINSVTNDYNGLSSLAGAVFPLGTTTVIWTIEDGSGNKTTCSYTVTVEDHEFPTITCVGNQTKNTDPGVCTYTVTGTEFDPTATWDNCSINSVTNDYNGLSSLAGAVFPLGTTTVIWTIEDGSGNKTTCSYTVTVEDHEFPTISCVGNQTKNTDPGVCTYTVTGTEFDPTATWDNCSINSVTNDYNGLSSLAGAVFPLGTTTVIWTIEDGSGNKTTCSYTVTVEDHEFPTISCVGNQTKNTNPGVCTYTVTGTEFDPTATWDNCSINSVTNDYNGLSSLAGAVFPLGTTTVIWTIEDGSGNKTTCSYTVTVEDHEFPTITCVGNQTKNTDPGVCTYTVTGTEFDPTATWDNCSINSVTNDYNGLSSLAGAVFPLGTTTVIWTIEDGSGNKTTCSYTVTVEDHEFPTISCVGNQTKNTDPGVCTYTVTGTEFDPTATWDNCSINSVTNDYNGLSSLAGAVFPLGTTTVIWTIEDGSGNKTTCSYTVTVEDHEFPTITCVGNQTKNTDPGVCTYTVTGTEFDPTATWDNCSINSVTNDYNGLSSLAGAVFPLGTTTVIWTIEDGSGNKTTCSYTVTVEDHEFPTISCVGNQTKNTDPGVCTYTVTGTEFDPTATWDNCSINSVTNDYNGLSSLAGAVFPLGTTTVIWTIEDGSGNKTTCSYTVTVEDHENPTITCVGNQTKNTDPGVCTYTVTGTEFDPTATWDNCSINSVTNDYNGLSSLAGAVFPLGTTTVIWTIEDGSGNKTTCSYTVTVEDHEFPTITCVGNQTKNTDPGVCTYTVTGTEFDPTATWDNCSINSVTNDYNGLSSLAGAVFPLGTTTVIWTIEDGSGNKTTCSYTVTVEDHEFPTITCVGNQTKNTDPGVCTYTVTGTEFDPTATWDNCSINSVTNDYNGLSSLAGAVFPLGTTTVIWTIEDGSGNKTTCSYTVTVEDHEFPTITCVGNQTKNTNPGVCTYTVTGTEFDPTATWDNCSINSVTNDYNGLSSLAGAVFPLGTTTVIWTIEDGSGNKTTCSYTVTVEDHEFPTISCVGNQTKNTNPGVCTYTVTGTEFDPTATWDNCSINSVTNDYNGLSSLAGAVFPLGTTTVIWTIEDGSGNKTTCSYTVTVEDHEFPTITCVGNQTKNTDPGVCTYTVTGTEFDPTATWDNCSINSVTNDYNGLSSLAGAVFPLGTTTVIWTIEDGSGNKTTCSYTVTVEDHEFPTISCVGNQTKNTDPGVCTYTVTGTEFDPTATWDNCSINSVTNDYNGLSSLAGAVFPLGTTTVIWTIEDGSGNKTTCSYTVTVEDHENPTITCVGNQTKNTDPGVCTYTVTGTEFDPTATWDNCSINSVTNDYNGLSSLAGAVFPLGTTTVIWTIEDGSGNKTTCSYTVTVEDHEFPTITCVGNQTKNTDPGVCTYTVTGTEFDPTATWDNCSINSVTNDYNGLSSLAGAVFPLGTTTVIWTIEDGSGNKTTCSYTVTVEDHEFPTITCVGNQTKNTDPGVCTYTVTGTEFDPTATWDNCSINSVTNDYNGLSSLAGAVFPLGTTTVIWTIEDGSGNKTTCSYTVTVEDHEFPTITCVGNQTKNTDPGVCTYTVTGTEFDPTATWDNCSINSVTNDYNGLSSLAGAVFPLGTTTVTWTIEDGSGNKTTCSYTVTVEDHEFPTISCVGNQTKNTDPGVCTYTVTGTEFDPTATWDNCSINSVTNDYNGLSSLAGAVFPLGTTTVIWTIEDGSGNKTTCSYTVTVEDHEFPTFTAPADITICRDVTCSYDTDPSITGDVTDEWDNCSTGINAVYSDNIDNLTSCSIVGYITRTWSLTDLAGNTTYHSQIIWVQPVPRISVTVNDTICNNTQINFAIDSLVISRGTVMYDLNVTYPGGVTGNLSNGPYPITDITDNLANTNDSYQTVTYTFKPYIQGRNGDPTCHNGIDTTIYVIVEPTAKVTGTITQSEICNNGSATISLSSVTVPSYGMEFNVGVINNYPEISGYSDVNGLTVSDLINQTLHNSGDNARMIRYVITPVLMGYGNIQKCPGINDTVSVWVNPTPRYVAQNINPQICYGGLTNIVLNSPTIPSPSGTVRLDYSISATQGPAVVGGNRTPVTDYVPGGNLTFPYTNESDTLQSVYFIVTPKINGLPCANGITDTVTVKVHAKPVQGLYVSSPLLCRDWYTGALTVIPSKGADPYYISWTGSNHYSNSGIGLTTISNLTVGIYNVSVVDNLGCTDGGIMDLTPPSTEISLYSPKKLPANMYNVSCNGASDAELILKVTGGNAPPFTFFIVRNATDTLYTGTLSGLFNSSDPSTYFDVSTAPAGTYEAIIIDNNGCASHLKNKEITEPQKIAVTFDTVDVQCNGYNTGLIRVNSIQGGIGPYHYQWSTTDGNIPGSTTNDNITDLTAGTYMLDVTDLMNCPAHFEVVITQPDGIDLLNQEVKNVTCNGLSDGHIRLTFDDTYNYSWSSTTYPSWSSDKPTAENLRAGEYSLVVTDSRGCQKTYSYTVTEPQQLIINIDKPVLSDGYNIACYGGTVSVNATISGGTIPYTYRWTKSSEPSWGSSDEDQPALDAGNYRLVVTDANMCSTSADITLTQHDSIKVIPDITTVSCNTGVGAIDLNVSGGVGPYTYIWTGPSGASLMPGQEDQNNLITGDYSVVVTDSYSCQKTLNITMAPPAVLTISKTLSDYRGFNVSCYTSSDGSITVTPLTGVPLFNYLWTGPDGFTSTSQSLTGLRPGRYIVNIKDSKQCSLTDTTILSSPGMAGINLTPSVSDDGNYNINCYGGETGSIKASAVNTVGSVRYLWDDGKTGAERDKLRAGIYRVIIYDDNNCSASASVQLTSPGDIIISIADTTKPFCHDSNDGMIQVAVTGGVSPYYYEWSNGVYGVDESEISGLTDGEYTVKLKDGNGCEDEKTIILDPSHDACLEIPNAFSPNDDGINDRWNIGKIDLYPEAEVFILNRWGELVWKSSRGYPEPWDGRSKGKLLPMDSYHYTIDLHNGSRPIVGHVTIVK